MIIPEVCLSITFFANKDFDEKEFQKIIINTMNSMGYDTNNHNYTPWGCYERGSRYKHLFQEESLKQYFRGKELFKYLLTVDGLSAFRMSNEVDISDGYTVAFEKECQEIYISLCAAIVRDFSDIDIMALDIPIESGLCLDFCLP